MACRRPLSPGRRQAIIWTNDGPLGTNFSEISVDIHTFSFKKIHFKMSSGKWRPFYLDLNVFWIVAIIPFPNYITVNICNSTHIHQLHPEIWDYDIYWEIVFDPKRFGPVKGSPTVHALMELLRNCYNSAAASRNFVRILLLDYSKAFDLINHQIILQKLSDIGVPELLLRWITAFLTGSRLAGNSLAGSSCAEVLLKVPSWVLFHSLYI